MRIESTNIVNTLGEEINPATDETLLLLRRIVKMLESGTVVDSNMRQRLIVDSLPAIYGQYGLTNVGTNYPTNVAPGINTTVSYVATWNGPIDPRWTNIEQARISYGTGIRNNIL